MRNNQNKISFSKSYRTIRNHTLSIPKRNTSIYRINSFRYNDPVMWNNFIRNGRKQAYLVPVAKLNKKKQQNKTDNYFMKNYSEWLYLRSDKTAFLLISQI